MVCRTSLGSNIRILQILEKMNHSKKLIEKFNNLTEWDVCFGSMAILNLDYIKKILIVQIILKY